MTRILVTGSRDWDDWETIVDGISFVQAIYSNENENITLVVGRCPTGADYIAERLAVLLGWEIEPHPADWDKYGKAAGPIRNKEMVDSGADMCIAFPKGASRGTRGCIKLAMEAGIHCEIWEGCL